MTKNKQKTVYTVVEPLFHLCFGMTKEQDYNLHLCKALHWFKSKLVLYTGLTFCLKNCPKFSKNFKTFLGMSALYQLLRVQKQLCTTYVGVTKA